MHKRTATLLLFTAFALSTTSYAAPIKPKSVDKLMQLSDVQGVLKNTGTEMKPMFDQQAEQIVKQSLAIDSLNPQQQQAARQISGLMSSMNQNVIENPKFVQLIKDVYQKTYTEEEAQAYIAFLSSPLGKSITQKTAKLTGEVMQQSMQMATEMVNDPAQQQKFIIEFEKIMKPLLDQNEAKK
ncbi:hypothetical protein EC844_10130 [Acinetobacter calcoaceticus]|uniref:DUF2059 domain-containing protein n=1 Tax=Acinetobacter calcoaceticus TaxID=471 RepID=A0A4R1Y515_ACICA|nr:hypothetical protein EC844_10130 [Acinetobacter calcoaceticus]